MEEDGVLQSVEGGVTHTNPFFSVPSWVLTINESEMICGRTLSEITYKKSKFRLLEPFISYKKVWTVKSFKV